MSEPFENTWAITLTLLRTALTGGAPPEECKNLTPETLHAIFALSAKYDLAQMAAVPLLKVETLDKNCIDLFQNAMYKAVTRYEQMRYEISRMAEVFEQEGIPYLPLKGAVMREYYPEPWMRTSCDIDILVHESDLKRAIDSLKRSLSYKQTGRTAHDVSLNAGSRAHIELHYGTIENDRAGESGAVLSHIWDHASPVDGTFRCVLDDAMFAFYHIAHMAKHFEDGGCGVRPFLDLWILNSRVPDKSARNALLEQGGLLKFAEVCDRLAGIWFGDGQPDDLTAALQNYILSGGMYGSIENMVAVQKNQNGGRIRYIFRRLFLPYDRLRNIYPVLKKHKWLTPVMEVRRWIKMITDGRMNRTVRELKSLKTDENDSIRIQMLLKQLGLIE